MQYEKRVHDKKTMIDAIKKEKRKRMRNVAIAATRLPSEVTLHFTPLVHSILMLLSLPIQLMPHTMVP